MAHIKHSPTWNFYVGDPCYVIDDARWSDFCDALWAEQGRLKKEYKERTGKEKIL